MVIGTENKGTVTFDKKDVDKLIISIDNLISGLECTIDDADRLELNIYKNPRTASDYCKSVKK